MSSSTSRRKINSQYRPSTPPISSININNETISPPSNTHNTFDLPIHGSNPNTNLTIISHTQDTSNTINPDPSSQLTAGDLPTSFSPSKARAHAKTTHQLNLLKQWLTQLLKNNHSQSDTNTNSQNNTTQLIQHWEQEYKTLLQPSQNPVLATEILSAMQDLMTTNQISNSQRDLIHSALKEELSSLQQSRLEFNPSSSSSSSPSPSRSKAETIISELEENLTPAAKRALDSLIKTSLLLGISIPSSSSTRLLLDDIAEPLINTCTKAAVDLSSMLEKLAELNGEIKRELDLSREQMEIFDRGKRVAEGEMEMCLAETGQRQRETKQVVLKMGEYRDRIETLSRSRPGGMEGVVMVEDLVALRQRVEARRDKVRMLEERMRVFHGLPPDLNASREEVKRARNELAALKRRREELFEDMVG